MNNKDKTVTARQFAEANNLALPRTRKLLRECGVRISFARKNVNHYDSLMLDEWLLANQYRFSDTAVYCPSQKGDLFYCARRDHYVSTGDRSNKMSLCCVNCEKEIKSHTAVAKKNSPDKFKTIDPAVKRIKKGMADMLFNRELKHAGDVNAWMNDYE